MKIVNATQFSVTPQDALTTLHQITGGTDGALPRAGIILGTNGYLYGTTSDGWSNYGTVFRILTNGSSYSTLHQFTNSAGDGTTPLASLVQGSGADSTNFYGTTYGGGTNGYGTVFRMNASGTPFVALYQFSGASDGGYPGAALVQSYDGNYYGTTTTGGPNGHGTVFRMTPQGALTTLYSFTGGADGGRPDYDPQVSGKGTTLGSFDGYLYGTTTMGGSSGNGTVYKVSLATYIWSITGGTITSGQGTPNITWTAGSGGAAMICVTVSNSAVCSTNICSSLIPVTVPIAAGQFHSLVISTNGNLWAWGEDYNWQLGDGQGGTVQPWPQEMNPVHCNAGTIANAQALAAGSYFSLAADSAGTVWFWGADDFTNSYNDIYPPAPFPGVSNVVSLAAGYDHALALRADGAVFAWGWDAMGQLGVGAADPYGLSTNIFIQTMGLTQIVAVAAGYDHSVALQANGNMFVWGDNGSGQFGNNGTASTNVPTLVTTISNVIAIAAGGYHTIAITSNHTLWTFGDNDQGQLGRSGSNKLPGQVVATGLSNNVVAIAGGYEFTLAVTGNGQVYAFGDNTSGELGANGIASTNRPIQVVGLSNAIAVAASPSAGDAYPNGSDHSLAVTVNQGVYQYWGWGYNTDGEVGNGTSGNDVYAPALIQLTNECLQCVQLGTGGVFTAQCTGTLTLWFNDNGYSDNHGSYTATVYGVASDVIVVGTNSTGIAIGPVTNGVTYSYTASGYIDYSCGPNCEVDANGVDHNGVQHDCAYTGQNQCGFVCPNATCYSLVGKIQ